MPVLSSRARPRVALPTTTSGCHSSLARGTSLSGVGTLPFGVVPIDFRLRLSGRQLFAMRQRSSALDVADNALNRQPHVPDIRPWSAMFGRALARAARGRGRRGVARPAAGRCCWRAAGRPRRRSGAQAGHVSRSREHSRVSSATRPHISELAEVARENPATGECRRLRRRSTSSPTGGSPQKKVDTYEAGLL